MCLSSSSLPYSSLPLLSNREGASATAVNDVTDLLEGAAQVDIVVRYAAQTGIDYETVVNLKSRH